MTDGRDTFAVGRRQWLALAGGSLSASLAGCLGGGDSDDSDPASDGTTDDDSAPDDGDDSDDTSDNGADNGDDNSGDSNGSDDTSGDNGEPADPPESTLTDLRIGNIPNVVTLGLGDDELVSVTLTNDADGPETFTVDLAVLPANPDSPDPDPLYTDSQSVTLDAGDDQRLSFGGVTPTLDRGAYEVVATTPTAEASAELSVFGTTDVTVRVFLQSIEDGQPAQSGQLTITDAGTEVATATITDDGHPTVELPLGDTASYTAEVTNVNDGVFPDTTTTIDRSAIGGPTTDEATVDIVAGYPFDGDGRRRFTSYILAEDGGPVGQETESIMYGSYGESAYHVYYIKGTTNGIRALTVDDSPYEYGTDLFALAEEHGTQTPAHSMWVDGKYFFYPGTRERWEPADVAFNVSLYSHAISAHGLDGVTELDPEQQQYVGTDTVRGIDVDVYEIPPRDSTVYVDPETGYTIRYETTSIGDDNPNSYEVTEFFAYNESDTVDWELIKARSEHATGQNLDGEELEQLPWEFAGVDED